MPTGFGQRGVRRLNEALDGESSSITSLRGAQVRVTTAGTRTSCSCLFGVDGNPTVLIKQNYCYYLRNENSHLLLIWMNEKTTHWFHKFNTYLACMCLLFM